MSDMYFQNLPSTSTPIMAENLNKLNDIKVSSTQPSTGEKAWFKSGKNLFNKDDIISGYRLGSDGNPFADSSYSVSDYIPVNSSTAYVANWTVSTTDAVCYYTKSKAFISRNTSTSAFTTPSNCKWIRVSRVTSSINTAQVEQGTTATSYEEYTEKEIYIKNNNSVYEKFTNKIEPKTIWQGNLYTTNSYIDLNKALENNKLYIFTFYGLSSNYLLQAPFVYKSNYFQTAYYDGTNYFRMRLNITNNGTRIQVDSQSINNASNTALIAIDEID